ncbi:ACP S-malonyltransferase [Catellatospora sp. NEAU-YM18]|nr:ACP S-malonyltransferase [Catellatospora tritici]
MGPSQFRDVARFMLVNPYARELLAEADEVLGYPLFDRYRDAASDYSEYSQVAFFVNCVASARWAQDRYGRPAVVAGPSFGSKAAAVFAGSLGFADTVRLTAELARLEDAYFDRPEHRELVTHSFARTPADVLAEIRAELDAAGVWQEMSCYIDEDLHMLSLDGARVPWLEQRLRSAGAMPLYTMRPPMHCAAFLELRDIVEREAFARLRFADPDLPVVADQDGAVLTTGAGVRTMMLDGYVKPVRWPAVVASLRAAGIGRVVVAGPDTLFGRVPVTTANFEVVAANPRTAMLPVPQGDLV